MKIKPINFIIAATILMTTLTGCGGGGKEANNGKVTLKLAHYADQFETETVNKQIKAFMDDNPDIAVVAEPLTGDFWQVLLTRMSSNSEPDVFYLEGYQFPRFQKAGKLLDISDALSAQDKADFSKNLLDAFTEDEKLYAVPKDYNTLALFYNKDMFEEAGLEPPKTWDELKTAAEKLTKDGKYGLSFQNEIQRFHPLAKSNGAEVMKNGTPDFNSPEFIEAYEYLLSLYRAGVAVIPKDIGADWNGVAFARQDVAMTVEGYWMVQTLTETAPGLNFGVVPIPYSKEPASLMFTVGYSASKNTKHPEEAKKLINYLTNYDMQKVFVESERALPSRLSNSKEFEEKNPHLKPFLEAVKYSDSYNYGIAGPVAVDELAKSFEKILINDYDVKKALDEAEALIQDVISKQ